MSDVQSIFIFSYSGVNVIINALRVFILANILSEPKEELPSEEEESNVWEEISNKSIFPIFCDSQRAPCGIATSFEFNLERVLLFMCFFFKQFSFNIRFLLSFKVDTDSKSKLVLTFNRLVSLNCVEEIFDVDKAIYWESVY